MKLKLVKEFDGHAVGTVIEVEDAKSFSDVAEIYDEAAEKAEAVKAIKETKMADPVTVVTREVETTKEVMQEVKPAGNKQVRLESAGDLFQKALSGGMKQGITFASRIEQRAPVGMNETTSADGGYLVSHEIASSIYGRLFSGGKIYPKTTKIQVGPNYNGLKLPYLDIGTQTATSQPRLYRLAEGATKTPTKFAFGQHDLSLVKLIGLVPVTEELLQDKLTLEGYVFSQLKGQFAWRLDYDVLYGTAAGSGHIGILDASAAAFLTKPATHAATYTAVIVNQIIGGVSPQVRGGCEWYMSNSSWTTIVGQLGPGVTNLLVPIADPKAMTLQGYPVNVVDGMGAFGAGQVLFGNASEIVVIEKGGLQIDVSKEFYFDTDQVALRFVVRTAGAPVWAKYTALDNVAVAAFSTTT